MSWRRGFQFELCDCVECHDLNCELTPFRYPSLFGRAICRLIGHKRGHPYVDSEHLVWTCARRCGYVFQYDLPKAQLR